jgi:hypothetical protein
MLLGFQIVSMRNKNDNLGFFHFKPYIHPKIGRAKLMIPISCHA